MKIPAKRRDFGLLTSYFSDDNDLLAERSEFEHVIHVFLCQQVTCFYGFAGQSVSRPARKSRANQQ